MDNSKISEANSTSYVTPQSETTSVPAGGNKHSSDIYNIQQYHGMPPEQFSEGDILAKVEMSFKAYTLLQEVKNELEKAKNVRNEIIEFKKSIIDTVSEYKTKIDRDEKLLEEAKQVIERETKTYHLIEGIRWMLCLVGIASFLVIPLLAFIFIACFDKTFVLNNFSIFCSTLLGVVAIMVSLFLHFGLANLYRITSRLEKRMDEIDAKQEQ